MEGLNYISGGSLNALKFVAFYRPPLKTTSSDYFGPADEKLSFSLQVSTSDRLVFLLVSEIKVR
jgi:hypothetical protein